ncbi:flagellar motor protein MotA [Pedobacter psychrophilus]|uniref:Flagellar motor protein MotA n=1 Tax=Pedobacter psychrophilus TaxID=1826909 RepID=A0A179DF01_9SPHI|nr:MotA/TolQ/ExbB proton channel family protein [Pedobacter psychrophilus]OAQ39280.1 flagellar motor protein MotA [Pedobacter psychrophilus]
MANAPKPTTAKKENSKGSGIFAGLAIIICIIVGWALFLLVMGNGSNFEGGDNTGHPLPGNYFGMIYKGGYIVPFLMSMLLMVIVFSIERFFVISKAAGSGNVDSFVRKVQGLLTSRNVDGAISECDKQKGSVAAVIKSGLLKYKEVETDSVMDTEQKCLAIQKDIEEATALEMPMLEQNLTIIATLVSVGTLGGLLGTVTGMIKAFAGLATAGAPDQAQLANGISEALINTATGISTSLLAVISYNFFTSKIDSLTYSIDEAGFSIVQTYAATH